MDGLLWIELNPMVGGKGLPGITVEQQWQQQWQQTVGCQLWGLTVHNRLNVCSRDLGPGNYLSKYKHANSSK